MMDRDEPRLQAIEARLKALSQPRWTPDDSDVIAEEEDDRVVYYHARQGATLGETLIQLGDTYDGSGDDWNFCAHAPDDVEYLLSLVRCLQMNLRHHGDGC